MCILTSWALFRGPLQNDNNHCIPSASWLLPELLFTTCAGNMQTLECLQCLPGRFDGVYDTTSSGPASPVETRSKTSPRWKWQIMPAITSSIFFFSLPRNDCFLKLAYRDCFVLHMVAVVLAWRTSHHSVTVYKYCQVEKLPACRE